jgi:hypothetical protein
MSLTLLDLDYFKKVNDAYGHLVGDEGLKETARRIQATTRAYDVSPVHFAKIVIGMSPPVVVALGREAVVVGSIIRVSVSIRVIIILVGRIPRAACQSDKKQNHPPINAILLFMISPLSPFRNFVLRTTPTHP